MKHERPRRQQRPILAISSIKITVKVTKSLTLVSCERISLVQYGSQYVPRSMVYDLVVTRCDLVVSRYYLVVTRCDLVVTRCTSRSYEKGSRSYEMRSRSYEIRCRSYEIRSRSYEILPRSYEIRCASRNYEM